MKFRQSKRKRITPKQKTISEKTDNIDELILSKFEEMIPNVVNMAYLNI